MQFGNRPQQLDESEGKWLNSPNNLIYRSEVYSSLLTRRLVCQRSTTIHAKNYPTVEYSLMSQALVDCRILSHLNDKTLYLTAQTSVYRIRLNIPDVRPISAIK